MAIHPKKFLSLAFKNAIFYMTLILCSSLLIGYFIYRMSYNIVLQSTELNVKHTLEILDLRLQGFLDNVRKDILFISRSPYLKDYIIASRNGEFEIKQQILTSDYVSFLSSKPDYAQIRLIGVAQNGKEIIRVDRKGNEILVTNNQELQEKGSTSYFRETVKLPEDSVNFSIIDLNKEYGVISKPIMPTMRVSCPLWINQEVFGITVINTNMNGFFHELKKSVGEDFELFLINQSGQALIHPDSLKQFAFEYKKNFTIAEELGKTNIEFDQWELNKIIRFDENYYFLPVHYPKTDYKLIFGIKVIENKLLAQFIKWRWSIVAITLCVLIIMILLALWWLQKQSKSMQDIVRSIKEFEQDLEIKNLPIERNDEIGIIANTFSSMSRSIRNYIRSLDSAKRESELANQQKEEFLQNMSHEIRNPLHTILGMTRILEGNNPRQDQQPIIESLKFSTSNLLALTNDVLEFAKLKEGNIKLNNKEENIEEILESIVKSYNYEATSRKIELISNIDQTVKKTKYQIDRLRFSQIVTNLLSNALKFSLSGTRVELSSECIKEDNEKAVILFKVKDQGKGIPEQKQNLILQRFQQLEQPFDSLGGTGLGLPIVVQLLKLYHSDLKLISKYGQGSEFYFELELQKSNIISDIPTSNKASEQYQSIMIIDDDPQVQMLYQHVCHKLGIEVIVIGNLTELNLEQYQRTVDIIIADNYLGNESVIDNIDKIKKIVSDRTARMLITGDHNLVKLISASKGFFDLILQKPVSPEELLQSINKTWLWRSFSLPKLKVLYEDYDYNKELIQNALSLLIAEWESSYIKMGEAIRSKNQLEFKALVHKLANTLRRFELDNLEKIWRAIDFSTGGKYEELLQDTLMQFSNCIEYIKAQRTTWYS